VSLARPLTRSLVRSVVRPLVRSAAGGGGTSPIFQNLWGWWNLDETSGAAIDSHTTARDLTAVNSPTSDATGAPDGTRCRVTANSSCFTTTRAVANADFSFFGWARWPLPNAGYNWLVYEGADIFAVGRPVADVVKLYSRDASGSGAYANTTEAGTSWLPWLMRYKASTGLIELVSRAGVLASRTLSGGIYVDTQTFHVGGAPSNNMTDGYFWRCLFTDYWITDDELTWLDNAGAGRTYAELAAL
jgi:hypothetical protein